MAGFLTGQAARERFRALSDQVEFAYAEMRCRSSDEVGNEFRAEMAERLETQERSNRGLMYRVFGEIADPPDQTAMVPAVVNSLAGRLGRQTRIATADRRIICYARDGGCTRPGCLAPGYHSEVHHSPDSSPDGRTDADCLFFACPPDHKLVSEGHYQTAVTDTGRLAWTDGTQPPDINHAHHPEELLHGNTDPPEEVEK